MNEKNVCKNKNISKNTIFLTLFPISFIAYNFKTDHKIILILRLIT